MSSNKKIAVIGLGYVGLPLARLFATKYSVTGFDINQSRVDSLQSGTDTTFEYCWISPVIPLVCFAPLIALQLLIVLITS